MIPKQLQIGSHDVRIIHPHWNDRLFPQFGGKIGHKSRPLRTEEASLIFSEPLLSETRSCLKKLGFLILEVDGFDPKKNSPGLPWNRIVNDRRRLPEVNMFPHTDFDDVILYNRGNRRCGTGITGRTGIASLLRSSLEPDFRFPADLPIRELKYQLQSITDGANEYNADEDPLVRLIVSLHHALSEVLAFEPERCWPYISSVQQLIRQKTHRHLWNGRQVLLVSALALHYRDIPSQDCLLEHGETWRAHLLED